MIPYFVILNKSVIFSLFFFQWSLEKFDCPYQILFFNWQVEKRQGLSNNHLKNYDFSENSNTEFIRR
jgi:hypothetical protein